jgi:hypothetical protein
MDRHDLRFALNRLLRVLTIGLALASSAVWAEGIGVIKVVSGDVRVERAGQVIPGEVGMRVNQSDRVLTGRNGAVGLSFDDASMVSAGPNSTLTLEQFKFDPATQEGNFDIGLRKGTLSVISGKLIQKTPGSMRVKTPAAVLAVRGTEFVVQVEE